MSSQAFQRKKIFLILATFLGLFSALIFIKFNENPAASENKLSIKVLSQRCLKKMAKFNSIQFKLGPYIEWDQK